MTRVKRQYLTQVLLTEYIPYCTCIDRFVINENTCISRDTRYAPEKNASLCESCHSENKIATHLKLRVWPLFAE